MAIEFTSNPTKWENEGAEPSAELKKNGFQAGYKPPAGVFNHHWHETAECIEELQTKVSDIDDNKVDKVSGKGLSTNDFTSAYKTKLDNLDTNLSGKVDKVSGKGLSTNDFTSTYKTKLDNLDTNLSGKVDKVSGKGLSTNDFTSTYKTKLDNLDSSLSAKAPAYSYSTTDLTAGTSALATGKLYFVYE